MSAYYNECDPFAAAWLRQLIIDGLIAHGEVDERSIVDVQPADLTGFTQCHFFAGIGGWSHALRLAGWPDHRPVWTGSCPCQTFSSAARGRHVQPDWWPVLRELVAHGRPRTFFGEQVATAGAWISGVGDDMETLDYVVGPTVLPACSVGADHVRERFYFVGHTDRHREPSGAVNGEVARLPWHRRDAGRVVPPHGVSRDMVAFTGFGNAIVPALAAEVISAYMELT